MRAQFQSVISAASALLRRVRRRCAPERVAIVALNIAIFIAFCWLKFDAIAGKRPLYSGDLRIWATIAENPLFSRDFWLAVRPAFYPLLFKLNLTDPQIILVQVALGVTAWGALGLALSSYAPLLVSPLILACTLTGSLVTPVNAWDLVIRAESTSTSLLILTFASTLLWLRAAPSAGRPFVTSTVLSALVTLCALSARDTNAYLILLMFPVLAGGIWIQSRKQQQTRRRLFVCSAALLLTLSLGVWAAQASTRASGRYGFPLMNVIFKRILPVPEKRDYFILELKMPLSRELLSRRGKFASAQHRYAFNEPALQSFRDWVFGEGHSAYQHYLISHLPSTVSEAFAEFPSMVGMNPVREGRASTTPFTEPLDAWLVTGPLQEHPFGMCELFGVASLLGIIFGRAKVRILAVFGGLFASGALTQAYICFHGDAMEVARHSVSVGVLMRLALLVTIVLTIVASSELVELLRTRGRREPPTQRADTGVSGSCTNA